MADFVPPKNRVGADNTALCAQLALWAGEGDGMMVLRYVEQLIKDCSTPRLLDMSDRTFWPLCRECLRDCHG